LSYSLHIPCDGCKKKAECSDPMIFEGARDTIHAIGSERSHKGSGTITVECGNYEQPVGAGG
jgi:hypothetical protein